MQSDKKKTINQGKWHRPTGILGWRDELRFVAVSTVTGFKISGCSSKLRGDFRVKRGWQQMMNAIRRIEQFAEKIEAEFVAPIW